MSDGTPHCASGLSSLRLQNFTFMTLWCRRCVMGERRWGGALPGFRFVRGIRRSWARWRCSLLNIIIISEIKCGKSAVLAGLSAAAIPSLTGTRPLPFCLSFPPVSSLILLKTQHHSMLFQSSQVCEKQESFAEYLTSPATCLLLNHSGSSESNALGLSAKNCWFQTQDALKREALLVWKKND